MSGHEKLERLRVLKLVSRAMEDVRGLDAKFPKEEDAEALAEVLNGILEDAVSKIFRE